MMKVKRISDLIIPIIIFCR